MKILETRFLRGPNLFHTRPCYQAIVDLEELEDRPSTDFPGFVERLVEAIPTLATHRCSRGYEGGFVERLREGTYMAHIAEHVALELQCLAGTEVGFGRARSIAGRPGHYRVVVEYELESLVADAFRCAVALLEALARGEPIDIAADLERLREIAADAALGPSTRAIVEAARRRGIPCMRVTEDASLIQLGWGKHQKRIQATVTSNTSHIAVEIASDKHLTKKLLEEAGVPVPRGDVVRTVEDALIAARRVGFPVVVKPLDANQGKGVTVGVRTAEDVRAAFERARRYRSRVIVERHLAGDDHRVIVVNGQFMAAARRTPPRVVGDGKRTVLQLVEEANAHPDRGDGHGKALTKIPVDEHTHHILASQGLSIDSVPPNGMPVVLRGNANLSTGGTAEDVTAETHPEVAAACVRAARKIGLDVAGIDLVCRDISRPLAEQGGGVVEVNAAPGIRMHEHPSKGECHHVGEAILETLYPRGTDGRIPLVAVTGTNGKTTTTLLIAHAMENAGLVTGVATTEGIRIGGQLVQRGDCTGYWSARTILTSPDVEAAVLETARGGILKRGLGFDRCDVAVVTNVSDDHLGQDYVRDVHDIARVKQVVAEAATKAVVLNAENEHCVAMAARVDRAAKVIYFSMDDTNPVLVRHLEAGGSAVYLRREMIIMAIGEHRIPLVEASRLAFALHGLARHNVANALAGTAALWACGFDRQQIIATLTSFHTTVQANPLRLNLFTARGAHIVMDYAHNPASYQALIETARGLCNGRLVGVVSAPGDRQDEKLREMGAICGRGLDEVVAYDMDDRRGRAPGETARLLAEGAQAVRSSPRGVRVVPDVREALRTAFAGCRPGDLLVFGCASDVADLAAAIPDAEEVVDLAAPPALAAPGVAALAPAWIPLGIDGVLRAPRHSAHH